MATEVVWYSKAEAALAEIWLAEVPFRNRIASAAAQAEGEIASDPEGAGESRNDYDDRILFADCLSVCWNFHPERSLAVVVKVVFNRPRRT